MTKPDLDEQKKNSNGESTLQYCITRLRTTHLLINLLLGVLQRTKYSRATSGFANFSISAVADRTMSLRAVAHLENNTPLLELTLVGLL